MNLRKNAAQWRPIAGSVWSMPLRKPNRMDNTKRQPIPTSAKTSPTNWLAISAGLISVGTAILILFGFGVSLAVESTFGIPHAAVFDSTFELVDLASIAMLELIPSITDALADGSLIIGLYKSYGYVIGTIAGIFFLLAVAGWFFEPTRKSSAKKPIPATGERLHWGISTRRYIWGNIFIGLSIFLYPLLSLIGVIAIVVSAAVLSIVPAIGMGAGKAHINKWVIGPERCMASADLATRRRKQFDKPPPTSAEKIRVVHCVAVKKDKDLIASGRVVFYTSKAIVLVDDMGKAKRIPTANVIVEVIDTLPATQDQRKAPLSVVQ